MEKAMGLKIVEFPIPDNEHKGSAIAVLEEMLERARNGEINSVEVMFSSADGEWGTTSSLGVDVRLSAAMLIELGMRRLGFG
jgi:hypothetical protein